MEPASAGPIQNGRRRGEKRRKWRLRAVAHPTHATKNIVWMGHLRVYAGMGFPDSLRGPLANSLHDPGPGLSETHSGVGQGGGGRANPPRSYG